MKEFFIWYKHDNVRLFRRQIINKNVIDPHTGRYFQVKAGVEGQCDAYGFICRPHIVAVPIEVEFKNVKTPHSGEQKQWRAWCQKVNLPHITLRIGAGENKEATLNRWTRELDEFVGVYL